MLLRTLGKLTLEGSDFTWPKPLVLLGHLALEGPQDRRRVARLFWPEAADPMNSLTVALAQLRKGAPGAVEADRKTVQTSLECDARELCAALRAQEFKRALELYHGPFMDGLHLQQWGVELEEWLFEQRERLAALLRRALIERANAEVVKGQFSLAAEHAEVAEELSEAPPLAPDGLEHLHALLLAGESPRAEAVRQEAEGFGIILPRLPEEARAHLQAMLNAPAIPHDLPTYSTPFVGRAVELAALEALLGRDDVRLITAVGPGGSGKTRLSVAVVERQLRRAVKEETAFRQGIFFVPLASVASPEELVPALAEALGVSLDTAQQARPPKQQLLDYLQGKRVLLLLDNLEHLLSGDEIGLLSEMLQRAPHLKLLATSRERLGLSEEQLFYLRGLELPGAEASEDTTDYPAAELFCQRARRVAPDFALGPGDAARLRDICRLVEGMPLGLELAATWTDTLPLADIASGIRQSLDFLEAEWRDVPERHWSLRAVFDYSYGRLKPQEQRVFSGLSVFRGGCTREAAERVAEASPRILAALVEKSLLHFERSQNRYHLHELLRQYGAEQLAHQSANGGAVCERHSAYFCGRLERLGSDLNGPAQQAALGLLEADGDNLQVAWHWAALRRRSDLLAQAADVFGAFLQRRGHFRDGARAFAATKAFQPFAEPQLTAKLLAWEGVFGCLLGDAATAALQLGESLALLTEAESKGQEVRAERAFTLLELGRIKLSSDAEAAERLSEESLTLYRALRVSAGMAEALSVLGEAAFRRGDGPRAGRLFQESLVLRRMLEDEWGVARLLPMLSFMAMYGTQFEMAAQLAKESYALCRQSGDRASLAGGLGLLGMSTFWLGRFAEARSLFEESLALYIELGNRHALPQAQAYVGLANLRLGRYQETRVQGERSLALARDLGNQAMVGWCLWLLGCGAVGQGRYGEAKRLLTESVATYQAIGQESELGWSLAVLGLVERKLGRSQLAQRILLGVLTRSAEARDFPSVIQALPGAALLLLDEGQEVRAVELLALMRRYPTVEHCHWFEDVAVRQLTAAAASLPDEIASVAQARGRALELWEAVETLLHELADFGWADEAAEA